MVKRKRGDFNAGFTVWNYTVMGSLAVGLCALLLISVGAMWHWVVEGQRFASPYYTYSANGYYQPTSAPPQIGMLDSNIQVTANLATILPEGATLMLSTTSGDLLGNEPNSVWFNNTSLHGEDINVAPDGKTLAYIRSNKLYIYQNDSEHVVPIDGEAMMPAWDVSGKRVAFVIREAVGDTVYRVALRDLQPERLLTVSEIAAPPLTNPATGRLLIVEKLGVKNTSFYTIDANCATQSACEQSRRDIATIKYTVNWADYHPNAATIVFSDMDDGNLYLLFTGSGIVQEINVLKDRGYKRRPAFSNDGTWLAYTNVTDGNKLYLFEMTHGAIRPVPLSNVASVDWGN
jgi:hypothetical protein